MNREDLNAIHDVVWACASEDPIKLTDEQCAALVCEAPYRIRHDAAEWGWNDTQVMQDLGEWIHTEHGAWALRWAIHRAMYTP